MFYADDKIAMLKTVIYDYDEFQSEHTKESLEALKNCITAILEYGAEKE